MGQSGTHATGTSDNDHATSQFGFARQPCRRPLRQVAARLGSSGPRAAAGCDGGFEKAPEPEVEVAPALRAVQRIAHLVEHLVFTHDRAFESGRDPHQVRGRGLAL